MKFFAVMITLLNSCAFASSFPYTGDGSDSCDFNNSVLNKELYNCRSLIIQGTVTISPAIINPITIRVIDDAHIYGTLEAKGPNGLNGINTSVAGIAGGYSSKSGPVALSEGQTGTPASSVGGPFGGGGGGGAAHHRQYLPTAGAAPTLIGALVEDATAGAAGSTHYGDESQFEITFYGGAGGGTGSSGLLVDGNESPGGSGGAGGSAIRIIAGGLIEIHPGGKISVDGGNGGNGNTYGGGGGGGAGGSLFLQSQDRIINHGIITSNGGLGGTGGTGSGNGGDGAKGRIRLDDFDGVIEGSGSITPSPYTRDFLTGKEFKGSMTCGTTSDHRPSQHLNNLLSLFLAFILLFALRKKAL